MSSILIHAISRYICTHSPKQRWKMMRNVSIHWTNNKNTIHLYRKKIKRFKKLLTGCVRACTMFTFKGIDARISVHPTHDENRFQKKVPHVYVSVCICVYVHFFLSRCELECEYLSMIFFLWAKRKIKSVESRIYCRCRYHFTQFTCTRSLTQKLLKSQILMKFKSIYEIFLAMMLYQGFSWQKRQAQNHRTVIYAVTTVCVYTVNVWLYFLVLSLPHEIISCGLWLKDQSEF